MTPRMILTTLGTTVTLLAAVAVPAAFTVPTAAAAATVTAASTQADAPGPQLGLIAVQQTVTVPKFANQPVFINPDVYVASYGSDFQLDVQRANYTAPVTVTQVISTPQGTQSTQLPGSVLDGWNGLKDFIQFTLRNAHGKVVDSRQITFCPNSGAERATPDSPVATDPYPRDCGSFDPFPLGEVWGLPQGWATNPFGYFFGGPGFGGPAPLKLALGKYRATVSITPQYRSLFGISAGAATTTVAINVVDAKNCSPLGCGAARRNVTARQSILPPLPQVRTMTDPPQSALPQLAALPSWNIGTSRQSGHDWLNFGATVWVGGNSPLDVEGFHVSGSPLLAAYQYFWQDGKVIGRARVGTMGFDSQPGHTHWHFEQFAQYQLLTANQKLAIRSEKVGFCIAPTDGVDMLLPQSTWQPSYIGLAGQCGFPGALWVREYLPVGWGDTYNQFKAGQAFDITNLPNGTYYIEVIANPLHQLYELSTAGNTSLRKVIIGGRKGHRTVKVPAWNNIDPEG